MPFELLTATPAILTSVTPRTETHGDEKVFAISLGLKLTGANTLLDKLSPTLRTTLYKAVEGQDGLPGIEESTPLLRTRGIDMVNLAGTLEGWTITVDHGIDEHDPITLGGAKVDKFRVSPNEGGSVELLFRVGSNDIDATEAGLLCSHLSQEIMITLKAPQKPAEAIDGTGADFLADHPEADAGDLFAAAHGQDDGPQDDDGADNEGSTTDVDDDGAEFEAGAAQALAAAGVKPGQRIG